jgi:hypothetical protein
VAEYLGERPFADSERKAAELGVADRLNERLGLRDRVPPRGNAAYRAYAATKDFHSHKWMYDAESLTAHVEAAGFRDAREREYLDSDIEGIRDVELRKRVIDECGVIVEGAKP